MSSLLAAGRLSVSEAEEQTFANDYPQLRASADSLYLPVPDFAEPATKFDPTEFYPTA